MNPIIIIAITLLSFSVAFGADGGTPAGRQVFSLSDPATNTFALPSTNQFGETAVLKEKSDGNTYFMLFSAAQVSNGLDQSYESSSHKIYEYLLGPSQHVSAKKSGGYKSNAFVVTYITGVTCIPQQLGMPICTNGDLRIAVFSSSSKTPLYSAILKENYIGAWHGSSVTPNGKKAVVFYHLPGTIAQFKVVDLETFQIVSTSPPHPSSYPVTRVFVDDEAKTVIANASGVTHIFDVSNSWFPIWNGFISKVSGNESVPIKNARFMANIRITPQHTGMKIDIFGDRRFYPPDPEWNGSAWTTFWSENWTGSRAGSSVDFNEDGSLLLVSTNMNGFCQNNCNYQIDGIGQYGVMVYDLASLRPDGTPPTKILDYTNPNSTYQNWAHAKFISKDTFVLLNAGNPNPLIPNMIVFRRNSQGIWAKSEEIPIQYQTFIHGISTAYDGRFARSTALYWGAPPDEEVIRTQVFDVERRNLVLTSLPRANTPLSLKVYGTQGRNTTLLSSSSLALEPQVVPGVGVLFLDTLSYYFRIVLGLIGPNGTHDFTLSASHVGPSNTKHHYQLWFNSPRELSESPLSVSTLPEF